MKKDKILLIFLFVTYGGLFIFFLFANQIQSTYTEYYMKDVITNASVYVLGDDNQEMLEEMYGSPLPYNITFYVNSNYLSKIPLYVNGSFIDGKLAGAAYCSFILLNENYTDITVFAHEYMHILQAKSKGCFYAHLDNIIYRKLAFYKNDSEDSLYDFNLSATTYSIEQEGEIASYYSWYIYSLYYFNSTNYISDFYRCLDCDNYTKAERYRIIKDKFTTIKLKYI